MGTHQVQIPSLLAEIAGSERLITVRGDTVRTVLEDLFQSIPGLRVHILDESGGLRPHVLCFVGDTNTRWMQSLDAPVPDRAEFTILQAVSGG